MPVEKPRTRVFLEDPGQRLRGTWRHRSSEGPNAADAGKEEKVLHRIELFVDRHGRRHDTEVAAPAHCARSPRPSSRWADLSPGRPEQAAEDRKQGRFPRTVGPRDHQNLARHGLAGDRLEDHPAGRSAWPRRRTRLGCHLSPGKRYTGKGAWGLGLGAWGLGLIGLGGSLCGLWGLEAHRLELGLGA